MLSTTITKGSGRKKNKSGARCPFTGSFPSDFAAVGEKGQQAQSNGTRENKKGIGGVINEAYKVLY